MDFDFKIKTLVNELAPVLVLLELVSQKTPLSAAELNRNITAGRFLRSASGEQFKFQPSLIYNLMKALVDAGYLSRDAEENTYTLKPAGRSFVKKQVPKVREFINDLEDLIREAQI